MAQCSHCGRAATVVHECAPRDTPLDAEKGPEDGIAVAETVTAELSKPHATDD